MRNFAHYLSTISGVRTIAVDVPIPTQDIEMIDNGDHIPAYILENLPENLPMEIRFYPDLGRYNIPHPTSGLTFWAEPGGAVEIHFPTLPNLSFGDGFALLGLVVNNGAKLAKRLKELVRLTKFWTKDVPFIREFPTTPENVIALDGNNVISMSFAIKMAQNIPHKKHREKAVRDIKAGRIVRVNLRSIGPDWFIKGDAWILPNREMIRVHGAQYDIVAPDVNFKSEIHTAGACMTTFFEYHEHGQAMFDVQSASWLREWLYPRGLVKRTLTHVINEVLEALRNGEWPEWMVISDIDDRLERENLEFGEEQVSEQHRRHYLYWQSFGLPIEMASSIMSMAAYAFAQRIGSKLFWRDQWGRLKPKMWLPLPWAVRGHVTSHTALELLGGFTIPAEAADKRMYHATTHSFSTPGAKFTAEYKQKGGEDGDDAEDFNLRRVYADAVVQGVQYYAGEVVAVEVRKPNSDGEYAVSKVYDPDNFPVYHTYEEMPLIDLRRPPLPLFIKEVQATQTVTGLPPDNKDTHPFAQEIHGLRIMAEMFGAYLGPLPYLYEDAVYMVNTQSMNPGIGSVANALMVTYAATGRSPQVMAAEMEDMVDAAVQNGYPEAFQVLQDFPDDLWLALRKNQRTVDSYLIMTRVPGKVTRNGVDYPMRKFLIPREGYFADLYNHLKGEYERFTKSYHNLALEKRRDNVPQEIWDLQFTPYERDMARDWVEKTEERMAAVTAKYRQATDKASKQARAREFRAIVNYLAQRLLELDADNPETQEKAHTRVLAMYQYCVTPSTVPGRRFGRVDRCLFSPSDEDSLTPMQILVQALVVIGLAHDPLDILIGDDDGEEG